MKNLYFSLLLMLLFGFGNLQAQEAGHTEVSYSVDDNGALTYQVPIVISPGTRGLEPKVVLSYHSQSSNGLLGMGWSLGGFSIITRSPSTLAHDNEIDRVDFDSKDRFILDGERLQVISGVYGADASEYRTEHESFNKVVSYGTAGAGPEKFKVWTKEGFIMEYGFTTDSRVEAQGKADVLIWRINRVTDRHGNFYSITYHEDNSKTESYPLRIDYTGNDFNGQSPYASVQFEYEDRTDKLDRYIAGSLMKGTKRLKSVKSYYGNSLVRSYTLTYENLTSSDYSIIRELQECTNGGRCFDPIRFEWTDEGSNQFGTPTVWSSAFGHNPTQKWNLSEHPRLVGDVNNDGKLDVVGFGDKGVYLSLSTGSRFETPKLALSKFGNDDAAGKWLNHPRLLADVNGDGQVDIVGLKNDSVHVALSKGDGFETDSLWLTGLSYDILQGKFKGKLADVDGDGAKDLVIFKSDGVYVSLSKGKGFAAPSNWIGAFCYEGVAHSSPKMGDVNGDGKEDVIGFCSDGVYVALANSNSFTTPSLWVADFGGSMGWDYGKHPIELRDVNGDGYDDVVGFFDDGVYVSTSSINSFNPSAKWVNAYGFNQTLGVFPRELSDVNGDGKQDVVAFGTDSVFVSISDGTGFHAPEGWIENFGYNDGALNGTLPPVLADANGDSMSDIVLFGDDGTEVAVSTSQAFDEAKVWVSAFNVTTEWIQDNHPRTYADINGDGLPDIVGFGDEGVKVAYNNGNGFEEPFLALRAFGYNDAAGRWRTDKHIRTLGDIDADGYPDIFGFGGPGVYIAKGNGSGFDAPVLMLSKFGSDTSAGLWTTDRHPRMLADMNGDGRTDIVGYSVSGVEVALSNGNTFDQPKLWGTNHKGGSDLYQYPRMTDDINGDGMDDIIEFAYYGVYISLSEGDTLTGYRQWYANYGYHHGYRTQNHIRTVADVNGDGLSDIVVFDAPGILVSLSTGDGLKGAVRYLNGGLGYNQGYRRDKHVRTLSDVNGDGVVDAIGFTDSGVQVAIGKGNSFNPVTTWSSSFGNSDANGKWNLDDHIREVLDVDGDGFSDVIAFGAKGIEIALSSARGINSIRSINNAGYIAEFTYKPATDPSVYTKYNTASYPEIDFIASMYLISSKHESNGIGAMNETQYHYEGAKINLRGRGLRGFAKVSNTNMVTGVQEISFYNQDHLFTNTPITRKERRLITGDRLIGESVNILGYQQTYVNKVTRSFVHVNSTKSYDLEGNVLKDHTTTYEYDVYGNPTYQLKQYQEGHTVEERFTYINDDSNWQLAKMTRSEITRQNQGQAPLKIVNAFEYSNDLTLVAKEIVEPDLTEYRLETSYSYDVYGNKTSINVFGNNGIGPETRTSTYTYDDLGRFVLEKVNPLGHKEVASFEPLYGRRISVKDPNNLSSSATYDPFGRTLTQTSADQVVTTYDYKQVRLGNFSYSVSVQEEGSAVKTSFYDFLDRKIRTTNTGFNNQLIYEDINFNEKGLIDRVSEPYFTGETIPWTRYEYDEINRLLKETAPDNSEKNIQYQGLVKVTTNPLNQTLTEELNMLGKVVSTTDHLGNTVTYTFDSHDRNTLTKDAQGNDLIVGYDLLGRKTSLSDPDLGTITYEYNTFGELIRKTDAKSNVTTVKYDQLGRMVERVELEGTSTWTYDQGSNAKGKLSKTETADGYVEEFQFDDYGRPLSTKYKHSDGKTFEVRNVYNNLGQIAEVVYPTGFTTRNIYDAHGYLKEVRRASDQSVFWRGETKNARGQLLQGTYGNGLVSNYTYDSYQGWLLAINTQGVQNLTFEFDVYGNLVSRSDADRSLKENFQYDGLNRLIMSEVEGQNTVMLTYDNIGNITYKSDIGCYLYGEYGAGIHAVTSIKNALGDTIRNYRYDASGNMIQSHDIMLAFSSYNMATSMTRGQEAMNFGFGIERQRVLQQIFRNGSLAYDKRYVGKIYEYELDSAGSINHIHYVYADGKAVAIHKSGGSGESTKYLHRDHLGSVQSVTDETGAVVEVLSFDAWGMRRNPLTWAKDSTATINSQVSRGFTDHEHLSLFDLIHMGGRIYDPLIGRFTSADPFVQSYGAGQNLNRYTYVLNNPLSYTDPTGFFFKKVFKAAKKAFKKVSNFVSRTVKTTARIFKATFTSPQGLLNFGLSVGLAYFTGGASLYATLALVAKSTLVGIGTQAVLLNAGIDPTLASLGTALVGSYYFASATNMTFNLSSALRTTAAWGINKGLQKLQGPELSSWLAVPNGLASSFTVNKIAGGRWLVDGRGNALDPEKTNGEGYGLTESDPSIRKMNEEAAFEIHYLNEKWQQPDMLNGMLRGIERTLGPNGPEILDRWSNVPLIGVAAGSLRDVLYSPSRRPGLDVVGRVAVEFVPDSPEWAIKQSIKIGSEIVQGHASELRAPHEHTYQNWLKQPYR